MKDRILSFALLLFAFAAHAQTDSLNFANAKWESKHIARGVTLKHYWFKGNLFSANQNVNVLDITPNKKNQLVLGYSAKTLKPVADFVQEYQAIAGINGGFFDVKNGGSVDLVKVQGIVVEPNHLEGSGDRAEHQQGALVFHDNTLSIAKYDGTLNWEHSLNGDVLVAGPMLVYQNVLSPQNQNSEFVKTRHPRTCVAVTQKHHVLLVTVDGRSENSAGVSIPELAKIAQWLKAKEGINMDGGGSSTLFVKGQEPNGVVNYPTDNKKWDHDGARKVANAVLLKQ